jgi:hypothetical protein
MARFLRIHYGLVAAATVATTAFLWRWDLLFPPWSVGETGDDGAEGPSVPSDSL